VADGAGRRFDREYVANWFPTATPTLIPNGGEDRIVDQSLWNDERYCRDHVRHDVIEAERTSFEWSGPRRSTERSRDSRPGSAVEAPESCAFLFQPDDRETA
jgi:hypothetical protein